MLKSLISNFLFFIISVIVLFFYQINVNNLTTEYVINSLIGNFILLIFIYSIKLFYIKCGLKKRIIILKFQY